MNTSSPLARVIEGTIQYSTISRGMSVDENDETPALQAEARSPAQGRVRARNVGLWVAAGMMAYLAVGVVAVALRPPAHRVIRTGSGREFSYLGDHVAEHDGEKPRRLHPGGRRFRCC